ncbi:hypothetical protein B8W66_13940 [Mycobacterium decipiens]|uniref:Uncharacterized protein n=1 Tax=Mycobacterium decipiens TaxID=1430326 RepID=A0A1X2LUY5_9MYCO|nr:hypothetical protein B8W66_13940 [Mycobacterium decipiens]
MTRADSCATSRIRRRSSAALIRSQSAITWPADRGRDPRPQPGDHVVADRDLASARVLSRP